MTLMLHAYCGYPSYKESGIENDSKDWAGQKFIKALKDKPFKGYAWIPLPDGKNFKLWSGNSSFPLKTIGVWAATRLADLNVGEATLVPVPSSTHVDFGADFLPKRICNEIAKNRAGLVVKPIFAFKVARPRDHDAGKDADSPTHRQSEQEIYENLRCSVAKVADTVVLVDDMCTQGRHFRVCAKEIRRLGGNVAIALAPGRTVWERPPDIFSLQPEELEMPQSSLAKLLNILKS